MIKTTFIVCYALAVLMVVIGLGANNWPELSMYLAWAWTCVALGTFFYALHQIISLLRRIAGVDRKTPLPENT